VPVEQNALPGKFDPYQSAVGVLIAGQPRMGRVAFELVKPAGPSDLDSMRVVRFAPDVDPQSAITAIGAAGKLVLELSGGRSGR
jgi:hypothetical protein